MILTAAIVFAISLVVAWIAIRAFRHGRRRLAWIVIGSTVAVLACLAIAAGFGAAYVFRGGRIQGRAMEPTLRDRDRVFVNRLAYTTDPPRRGDIVMLQYPLDPSRMFVKRIVAVGNDDVRIADGKVYVNGVASDDSFIPADNRSHDSWGPQRIPVDNYFVLGDRRNNSSDSRHWGNVPKKYIVGRVQYRWWPIGAARGF